MEGLRARLITKSCLNEVGSHWKHVELPVSFIINVVNSRGAGQVLIKLVIGNQIHNSHRSIPHVSMALGITVIELAKNGTAIP